MRSVFFYGACIAFLCGVTVAVLFPVSHSHAYFLLLLGVAHGLVSVIRSEKAERRNYFLFTALLCVFVACGMLRVLVPASVLSPLAPTIGKEVVLYGMIVREPDVRDTLIHLTIRPHGLDRSERVLVTTPRLASSATNFEYGDSVEVRGTLTKGESFTTDTGRMFNYEGYLRARGIEAHIPFAQVAKLGDGDPSFVRSLYANKERFLETITSILPEPHAGLGSGILLGVKRALGADLETIFRETGVMHIVVLSGYNIMIIVSCALYLLSFFFFPRTRMIIGTISIWIFVLLVGFSATVVRAGLMATLLLFAQGTGRTYSMLRALMLVAVLMVIHNPYILVYDPGFQLSFLATLGLIVLAPRLEERMHRVPSVAGIWGILATTIAAQVMVFPLILYYTNLVSLSSILVNVLVLPMVPVAMALTAITGFLGGLIPIFGQVLGFFSYLTLTYIIWIPTIFASLPFSSITLGTIPLALVFFAYGVYGVAWFRLEHTTQNTIHGAVENEYEDWVIEEEKEKAMESRSDSMARSPLPFR